MRAPGVRRRAKGAIRGTSCAENKWEATLTIEEFASGFGVKWPKAVQRITSEKEDLLTFYDDPAQHWRRPRTTTTIESTFAPVRVRTDLTKEPSLAMFYELLKAAEGRWRKLQGS